MTDVLHSVSSFSSRSPRYRLRSFPGCFDPSISTLICMYFLFMHSQGVVVHAHKHYPGAMCAALVAERIDSIGARGQHDVPWILPKVLFKVQRLPLGPIRRVTQHYVFIWIIFSASSFCCFLSACQRMSLACLGSAK